VTCFKRYWDHGEPGQVVSVVLELIGVEIGGVLKFFGATPAASAIRSGTQARGSRRRRARDL
jgi:hypothetical protein